MKKKYKAICTLKENSREYVIYRNLDNNRYYKEIDGKNEKLPLEDSIFYKKIEKINDNIGRQTKVRIRKENVKKASRITGTAAMSLLIVSLLCTGIHASYVANAPKREYNHSEKTENDIMKLFTNSMMQNKTINQQCAQEVKNYLQLFVDECCKLDIPNDDIYFKIAKQLASLNFEEKNLLTSDDLSQIFNFCNGNFIANELYACHEEVRLNYRYYAITNFLVFNDDIKKSLFMGKPINVQIYGNSFALDLDNLEKNDKNFYSMSNRYINEIFGTDNSNLWVYRSNIFSSIIEKYFCSSQISTYFELEEGKLLDISYREYYRKLANIIYTEGFEFDYTNKTDRDLVYLYLETLRLNLGCQLEVEPVKLILNTLLLDNNYISPVISSRDFLQYLNGKSLRVSSLVQFWDILLLGEESVNFIQELNRCLKVEVSLGNLSQEDYEYFINMVIDLIEILYPERLEEFKNANLYNKSIENFKLELIPKIEI